VVDLQRRLRCPDLLRRRGYTQEAIEGIFFRNWLRFFERAWKKSG